MCNHCQSHDFGEVAKNQVRSGFLSMLAKTSSQISEMGAGIIVKDFGDDMEIGAFGSFDDVLSMASRVYISNLKVALDKAKSENDIQMAFMLFSQVSAMANNLKSFVAELDKTTEEIKSSIKEG